MDFFLPDFVKLGPPRRTLQQRRIENSQKRDRMWSASQG